MSYKFRYENWIATDFVQPTVVKSFVTGLRAWSIALILVALSFVPGRAQTQAVFDHASLKDPGAVSPAQQSALQLRSDLIAREVSSLLANEWAGTYVTEDSLTSGARLDWAPANGFVIRWTTCSHGWRDRVNFGRVDFRDGVLHVTSELGIEGEKVYAVAVELISVKWGDQHYLVPLDQLIAFCYAALNAGRSTEINQFFLKESDREKQRFGLPAVPPPYKKYLVGAPIQAKIVEVKPRKQSGTQTFTLNVGRTAGVVQGMKFFALFPRNVRMLVEIIDVRDNNSEAFVNTSGFKNGSNREVKPQVGWRLTSRAPRTGYDYP